MLLLYSQVLLSYGSLGTPAPAVHHTGPLADRLVQAAALWWKEFQRAMDEGYLKKKAADKKVTNDFEFFFFFPL